MNLNVEPTNLNDLEEVYRFFDSSILYQESKGYNAWKNYDKNAIRKDVAEGNQYKVMSDGQIAIVFSVCYADPVIWREREKGDAVYLHRIVVNPEFKGQKLFGEILKWTVAHAQQRKLRFVRMDTWGNNPTIIQYYMTFGFRHIANFTTPDSPDLPVHNRKLALALLEYPV